MSAAVVSSRPCRTMDQGRFVAHACPLIRGVYVPVGFRRTTMAYCQCDPSAVDSRGFVPYTISKARTSLALFGNRTDALAVAGL